MAEFMRVFGIESVGKNGYTLEKNKYASYPKHCHIFYELLLYQPFDGNITINEKTYSFEKPTAVLIAPSVFHSSNVNSGFVDYKKIIFVSDIIKKDILKHVNSSFYYSDINPLFSLLCDRIFSIDDNKDFVIQLIHTLLIEMIKNGKPIQNELPNKNIKLITDAINIINKDFTKHISLETVAKELNISKQYLSSKFTAIVGKTFTDYLSDIRLRYAVALLSESNLSVSEICYRSGYNNFSYFLRSFKRYFGTSPGQFKNQIR